MEVNLEGYLNPENNQSLVENLREEHLNKVKKIYIKLVDKEETIKIKNVVKQWNSSVDLFTPIHRANEDGFLIKLNTQKLEKYLGYLMLKTPRKEWLNKKYKVKFVIRKYSFNNTFENDNKKINGLHFILKNIDLLI